MTELKTEIMLTETQWDHEVDVVCIGAEGAVLATGLVAANAGFDVYLGISEPSDGGDLAASLGYQGGDGQTTEHLGGFDYAFGGVGRARNVWPVRAVEQVAPPRSDRRFAVVPFVGAALEQWANRCASSPNSLVYNRVTRRQMTEMRNPTRGEQVEVAVVGSVELSPGLPAWSLMDWLRSQAGEVGLQPETDVRLVKLAFEDGEVAGALIDSQGGVSAVRARENLVVGTRDFPTEHPLPLVTSTEPVTVSVCLVSKAASRFAELELVTATGEDNRLLFVDAPWAGLQLAGVLEPVPASLTHQLPSWHRAV